MNIGKQIIQFALFYIRYITTWQNILCNPVSNNIWSEHLWTPHRCGRICVSVKEQRGRGGLFQLAKYQHSFCLCICKFPKEIKLLLNLAQGAAYQLHFEFLMMCTTTKINKSKRRKVPKSLLFIYINCQNLNKIDSTVTCLFCNSVERLIFHSILLALAPPGTNVPCIFHPAKVESVF